MAVVVAGSGTIHKRGEDSVNGAIVLGLETDVVAGGLSIEYEVLDEVVATSVGGSGDVDWEDYVFHVVIGYVPWYVGEGDGC